MHKIYIYTCRYISLEYLPGYPEVGMGPAAMCSCGPAEPGIWTWYGCCAVITDAVDFMTPLRLVTSGASASDEDDDDIQICTYIGTHIHI